MKKKFSLRMEYLVLEKILFYLFFHDLSHISTYCTGNIGIMTLEP